jgi:hypothetical protein
MRPGSALVAGALLGACLFELTGGCAHQAPVYVRPYPPPNAEDLVKVLQARQAVVRSLNARVRATSWMGHERLRATVLMLVERRGLLRFEAEVSLQGTVAVLATDGVRFQLLDLQKNQLQQGPACPANVASLVRIPLAPPEIAAILLGDLRLPSPWQATEIVWDSQQSADILVFNHAAGTTRVSIKRHGNDQDVIGVEARGPRGRIWRTSYQDLENVGGVRLPSLIQFAEGERSFDDGVEIKFKDRTVNAEMRPGSFVIAPPAGTKVVEVGCGEGGD